MPEDSRIKKILFAASLLSDDLIRKYENEIISAYKLSLKEIQHLISEIYTKLEKPAFSDVVKYNRLTNLESDIKEEIKRLSGLSIKSIKENIIETFVQNYYHTGYALESTAGKLGFGLLNPKIIDAAILNPMDRITWIERLKVNQALFERQLRTALTQGFIQGKGYYKIAKDVQSLAEIGAEKTIRILRTEGHRVQNMARLSGLDKSKNAVEKLGLTLQKIWIHAHGIKDPRILHIEMNDVPADENGIFTLPDGIKTEAPGMTGLPEHDIFCHCSMIFKVSGFDNMPSLMTYDEWAQSKGIS